MHVYLTFISLYDFPHLRIGKYYAVEDMLTKDPSEKYGRTTLRQHYEYVAENGQGEKREL